MKDVNCHCDSHSSHQHFDKSTSVDLLQWILFKYLFILPFFPFLISQRQIVCCIDFRSSRSFLFACAACFQEVSVRWIWLMSRSSIMASNFSACQECRIDISLVGSFWIIASQSHLKIKKSRSWRWNTGHTKDWYSGLIGYKVFLFCHFVCEPYEGITEECPAFEHRRSMLLSEDCRKEISIHCTSVHSASKLSVLTEGSAGGPWTLILPCVGTI